jgi:hypothetical protein
LPYWNRPKLCHRWLKDTQNKNTSNKWVGLFLSATDLQVPEIVDCGCRAAFGSKSSLHHGLQVSGTTCQMITNCINKYIVYPVRVFCKKVVFTIYFVQCRLRHRCHFYRFISLCVVCWKATHELDSSRPNSS